jgi:hypothetical protein
VQTWKTYPRTKKATGEKGGRDKILEILGCIGNGPSLLEDPQDNDAT